MKNIALFVMRHESKDTSFRYIYRTVCIYEHTYIPHTCLSPSVDSRKAVVSFW